MIKIKNISKSFGDKVLFENYNLTINQGEYVIFSGVSGCGKTTLLNMIGSLEAIDEGVIMVDGIDISQKKKKQNFFGNKIGFLFQNFVLVEDKTVRENLSMINKTYRTEISIEEALKIVGLKEKIDNKIYTLSGGEQQRVALARVMIKKCNVILADEPTGSLDEDNANIVMEILEDLNKLGKTVIVVTHDENIKKRAERVIML